MITTLREGKAKLSALVDRASRGEEIVITVRGRPKARLCPLAVNPAAGVKGWDRRLREARATYSVGVRDSSPILDKIRGDRE